MRTSPKTALEGGLREPSRTRDSWKALAWNLGSQGGAAILGLLLVKLSVSLFSVPVFGSAALLLGLQTLARNTFFNPLLNLAIYQPATDAPDRGSGWLYRTTSRALAKLSTVVSLGFLILIWALAVPTGHRAVAALLLGLLLYSESLKTARLNLVHCHRSARAYSLWVLLDAASKPLAILLLHRTLLGWGPLGLLSCHVAGSLAMIAFTGLDPATRLLRRPRSGAPPTSSLFTWVRTNRAFLLPLAGAGLLGWFTGLSDRYLVNLFLGPESAGLYAGLYGIFSVPFTLVTAAMTLATRPRLLRMVAEGPPAHWQRELWHHFRTLALLLALLASGLLATRHVVVKLALSPPFLAALNIVPGIVLGNAVIALGNYLEIGLYLNKRADLTLVKQAIGATSALVLVLLILPRWGLIGAGWACILYASLEFFAGMILIRKLHSK
jgi:O-antigen/teichoic acid export membrane protein